MYIAHVHTFNIYNLIIFEFWLIYYVLSGKLSYIFILQISSKTGHRCVNRLPLHFKHILSIQNVGPNNQIKLYYKNKYPEPNYNSVYHLK